MKGIIFYAVSVHWISQPLAFVALFMCVHCTVFGYEQNQTISYQCDQSYFLLCSLSTHYCVYMFLYWGLNTYLFGGFTLHAQLRDAQVN